MTLEEALEKSVCLPGAAGASAAALCLILAWSCLKMRRSGEGRRRHRAPRGRSLSARLGASRH